MTKQRSIAISMACAMLFSITWQGTVRGAVGDTPIVGIAAGKSLLQPTESSCINWVRWNKLEGANSYNVYKNGELAGNVEETGGSSDIRIFIEKNNDIVDENRPASEYNDYYVVPVVDGNEVVAAKSAIVLGLPFVSSFTSSESLTYMKYATNGTDVLTSSGKTYSADRAVDGIWSNDSRWVLKTATDGGYFEIDLTKDSAGRVVDDNVKTISTMHICTGDGKSGGKNAPLKYHLEYYDETDEGWKEIPGSRMDFTLIMPSLTGSNNNYQSNTFNFEPIETKKVKFVLDSSSQGRVTELHLFNIPRLAAPSTPSNLAAPIATDDEITVTWEPSTGYPAYYELLIDGKTTKIDKSQTSHTIKGLNPSTTYTIEVKAVNSAGASAVATVQKTTAAEIQIVDMGLTATRTGNDYITLKWNSYASAHHYVLFRGVTPVFDTKVDTNFTVGVDEFKDSGLLSSTPGVYLNYESSETFEYYVVAKDEFDNAIAKTLPIQADTLTNIALLNGVSVSGGEALSTSYDDYESVRDKIFDDNAKRWISKNDSKEAYLVFDLKSEYMVDGFKLYSGHEKLTKSYITTVEVYAGNANCTGDITATDTWQQVMAVTDTGDCIATLTFEDQVKTKYLHFQFGKAYDGDSSARVYELQIFGYDAPAVPSAYAAEIHDINVLGQQATISVAKNGEQVPTGVRIIAAAYSNIAEREDSILKGSQVFEVPAGNTVTFNIPTGATAVKAFVFDMSKLCPLGQSVRKTVE